MTADNLPGCTII